MIKLLTMLLVCGTCLTACVTQTVVPAAIGDSAFQQKLVSFPRADQETKAKAGGLIHLYANYESRFIYRLTKPFSMSFMLGKIEASGTEAFSEATIDGKTYYCSAGNIYIDPLIGPLRQACFYASETGNLDKIRAAPGLVAMTKDVNPAISFIKEEVPWRKLGFLKRELIFDGMQDGALMFTQKIYEQSLTTPNRLKPHVVKVGALPAKITIDGAVFTIIKSTNDTLYFKLDTPWQ